MLLQTSLDRQGSRMCGICGIAVRCVCFAACLLCVRTNVAQSPPANTVPGKVWARESPGQAGWSLPNLKAAHTWAQQIGSTSVLVIQHGTIIAEWGDAAHRSNLHSARKSLLNALIGIAAASDKIHLSETLAELGIDDTTPVLTTEEKQATVQELLEARSGVYHPTVYETEGMREAKPERGSHPPGTFWYYNNWDFNTLGAIYERAAGESIFKAFDEQIAQPIGMQDYRPRDGHYVKGSDTLYPAYPIDMSARDFARFTLLYLHHGMWGDRTIVPPDWIAASLQPRSDTESGGYGYLWWTADAAMSGRVPKIQFPPGSFWAEGHLGQYAVVVPSLDLIVVNRVDSDETRAHVDKRQMAQLVWLVVRAADPKQSGTQ